MFQRTPNRVHVSAGTRVPPHLRKSTKPKLESTIHVVAHGSHIDAISIDGKSPLACSLWKCRDSDREHYVSKYRTQFYSRINCNDEATVQELERMMAQWQLKGCLYLSHDKPQLPCHASVISEYLCFELRRRGLAGDHYA